MSSYQLNAEARSAFGSNAVKKLRRAKLVPAQVYGQGKPNLNLVLAEKEAEKAIQSREPLYEINVGGDKRTVLIKEIQRDPIKGNLQHIDFFEVALDRPVDTMVGIVLAGEEARAADGGVVNLVVRELEISCLPTRIPEAITVDVSKLAIGDTLLVRDLQIPAGIMVKADPDEVVVTVTASGRAESEAADLAADEVPDSAPDASEAEKGEDDA